MLKDVRSSSGQCCQPLGLHTLVPGIEVVLVEVSAIKHKHLRFRIAVQRTGSRSRERLGFGPCLNYGTVVPCWGPFYKRPLLCSTYRAHNFLLSKSSRHISRQQSACNLKTRDVCVGGKVYGSHAISSFPLPHGLLVVWYFHAPRTGRVSRGMTANRRLFALLNYPCGCEAAIVLDLNEQS